MKTKLFTGLALTATLFVGTPAFAKDHKGRGHGNGHGKGRDHAEVVVHRGGIHHAPHNAIVRANRRGGAPERGGYPGRYAFASHRGWDHGREYVWNGNHYHWYHNAWFVLAPAPVVVTSGTTYATTGSPLSVDVQSALARRGYYRGPIDGIVGPVTRSAIAGYQRDNGLAVTGTITDGLVADLGV
jgi:hypothetical protein